MINVTSTIITNNTISANLNALILQNLSLDNSEEYELPSEYMVCAVKNGSIEYNGQLIYTSLMYSPEITKINISANSTVVIFSRQT